MVAGLLRSFFCFFFFQAEDGIRDHCVTGVQTCALPILTGRLDYNFTANVSWATLTQYDNESRIAGLQSRFRWILQPGNDLFLVLNRGWYRTLDDNRFEPSFDRASAKLQYTFRF